MNLAEIWPTVQTLSRADKMRLVQSIVDDLAQEEGIALVDLPHAFPIWTPLACDEAAAEMLRVLEETRS